VARGSAITSTKTGSRNIPWRWAPGPIMDVTWLQRACGRTAEISQWGARWLPHLMWRTISTTRQLIYSGHSAKDGTSSSIQFNSILLKAKGQKRQLTSHSKMHHIATKYNMALNIKSKDNVLIWTVWAQQWKNKHRRFKLKNCFRKQR